MIKLAESSRWQHDDGSAERLLQHLVSAVLKISTKRNVMDQVVSIKWAKNPAVCIVCYALLHFSSVSSEVCVDVLTHRIQTPEHSLYGWTNLCSSNIRQSFHQKGNKNVITLHKEKWSNVVIKNPFFQTCCALIVLVESCGAWQQTSIYLLLQQ